MPSVSFVGRVLRMLPPAGGADAKSRSLIVANERDYVRVFFRDERAELLDEINVGDVLLIENAYASGKHATKTISVGRYARVKKLDLEVKALRDVGATHLTTLAVARPERNHVCVAGIDEHGNWLRLQSIYEEDVFPQGRAPNFRNLCVSKVYVDEWRGGNPRLEDRFFVFGEGVVRELGDEEKRRFLEEHLDESVDAVFKSGRTLGLIKPRILRVYEDRRARREGRTYEQYIRFDFRDGAGRLFRGWSCRCLSFYDFWNEFKRRKRLFFGYRMLRFLRRHTVYFCIGLTHTDYGFKNLEYGAFPMVVGVHIV